MNCSYTSSRAFSVKSIFLACQGLGLGLGLGLNLDIIPASFSANLTDWSIYNTNGKVIVFIAQRSLGISTDYIYSKSGG